MKIFIEIADPDMGQHVKDKVRELIIDIASEWNMPDSLATEEGPIPIKTVMDYGISIT